MSLYRPSELQSFLCTLGVFPKKHLSQNFLIDGNILRKIVDLAGIQPDDSVVEIGSGPGALTELLLEKGAKVCAIEKDRQFAHALHRLQTTDHRLTVLPKDALLIDFVSLLQPSTKIIGNIPYHITTPLITRLLPTSHAFSSITLLVQKEVAKRWTAQPGTKACGSITLFVHFYADISYNFSVSPSCFYPIPKVQSAVIQLKPKNPPPVDPALFFQMTQTAFRCRRKMIRSSLKNNYCINSIDQGLKKIGKGTGVRPEELSLQEFLILFEEIGK